MRSRQHESEVFSRTARSWACCENCLKSALFRIICTKCYDYLAQAFSSGKHYMIFALERAQIRLLRTFFSTTWQCKSTHCTWKVWDAHEHGSAEVQGRRPILASSLDFFFSEVWVLLYSGFRSRLRRSRVKTTLFWSKWRAYTAFFAYARFDCLNSKVSVLTIPFPRWLQNEHPPNLRKYRMSRYTNEGLSTKQALYRTLLVVSMFLVNRGNLRCRQAPVSKGLAESMFSSTHPAAENLCTSLLSLKLPFSIRIKNYSVTISSAVCDRKVTRITALSDVQLRFRGCFAPYVGKGADFSV